MSKLKLLFIFILLVVWSPCSCDQIGELKEQVSRTFGDGDEDPFSKALQNLPDSEVKTEQIESIVGPNFSIVRKQWEEVRLFATNIVIGPMKKYQEIFVEQKPLSTRVFSDFYDMIKIDLDPATLSINKEVYIIYEIVDEETFTEVYTKLVELYKYWIPIKSHMDTEKEKMMNKIRTLTDIKHPNYVPTALEPFPNTVSYSIEPNPPIFNHSKYTSSESDPFKQVKTQSILQLEARNITSIAILINMGCGFFQNIIRKFIGLIILISLV